MTTILFSNSVLPYSNLSPFSNHPITIDGLVYPTVEHYYQSQKFVDEKMQALVRTSASVKEAFHLGHRHIFKIREDWHEVRLGIMYKALFAKFDAYPELKQLLLDTKDTKLVYVIPNNYWGRGSAYSGRNMFGICLMQVRNDYYSRTEGFKK